MQASIFTQYGSPDVLRLSTVEKPIPKNDEVLIKVMACGINAADWHILRASPFMVRLDFGLLKPKNPILGADIAGIVEAVGADVKEFKAGDAVFGDASGSGLGGFAEYTTMPASLLVLKPANLSFVQASTVPLAGITALQGLRHAGNITQGTRVLINGASGGVGMFAVQIAKAYGAEVTGVCRTNKIGFVQSIGADHVIDYTQNTITDQNIQYDIIIEGVGNLSVDTIKRSLVPDGRCIIIGFTTLWHMAKQMIGGRLATRGTSQSIRALGSAKPNRADLQTLKTMIENGKIDPHVDRTFTLAEAPDAMRYLEGGQVKGKIAIAMTAE